jgi:HK97 family phage major capsid protein
MPELTAEQRFANNEALKEAMIEADRLSRIEKPSKGQSNRFQFLSQKISALKSGVSIDFLNRSELDSRARAEGFDAPDYRATILSHSERRTIQAWQSFFKTGTVPTEYRDVEGLPLATGYFQGAGGTFVPFDFFRDYLPQALKAHDPVFDDESVTRLITNNGSPLQVSSADVTDPSNDAVPVSELSSPGYSNIANPTEVLISLTTYRTPMWKLSMESLEDIETAGNAIETFRAWSAGSLARGIGRNLMAALLAAIPTNFPTATIIASGSSANTGGSETGANSLGTKDFAAAWANLDDSYKQSPRCAWWLNDASFQYVNGLLDKQGRPVGLIRYCDGVPTIFGRPVRIAPSMSGIGSSNLSALLLDGSQFMTRLALDTNTYIKLFRQASGLAENGNVGLRVFLRAGGAWMISSAERPPVIAIQNHS